MPDGSSSPPTVRGVVLLGLFDWVRATHGEPGVEAVLAALSASIRPRYEGPRPKLIATTPVAASELAEVAAAIIDGWGRASFEQAAAHVALSDLSSYMKLFLKVGSPAFIVRRLPRVLNHYASTGVLEIESCDAGRARMHIRDVAAYGRAMNVGTIGWVRAAPEVSGAHGVDVQAELGEGTGTYEVRWT